MITFIRRYQIARKEHSCDVCGYKIRPGQPYVRHVAPLAPGEHGWLSLNSCGETSSECNNYWVVDSKLLAKEDILI